MAKRRSPFEDDLRGPQLKYHIGEKEVDCGVSKDNRMPLVYDKTLLYLYNGVNHKPAGHKSPSTPSLNGSSPGKWKLCHSPMRSGAGSPSLPLKSASRHNSPVTVLMSDSDSDVDMMEMHNGSAPCSPKPGSSKSDVEMSDRTNSPVIARCSPSRVGNINVAAFKLNRHFSLFYKPRSATAAQRLSALAHSHIKKPFVGRCPGCHKEGITLAGTCLFCERFCCSDCLQTCPLCHGDFCPLCSVKTYSSVTMSICFSCQTSR